MISLTREIRFSLEGQQAPPALNPSGSANSWAGWPTALALAPFLRVELTLVGSPHRDSGYLCDIKILDDLLRSHALEVAGEWASDRPPTPEQFLTRLWTLLADERPGGGTIERLVLWPTPYLCFAIERASLAMIFLTEQFEFSAAHRLHNPDWSEERNREIFGKCNNPNGHGHNYVIEVVVSGEPRDGSGLVLPRSTLSSVVKRLVLDRFDHKHLNEDTTEFGALNPTVENLAEVIFGLLVDAVAPARLECVRVQETPRTRAERHRSR